MRADQFRTVTDDSIEAVATGYTSLISLKVASCNLLTNESIKAVLVGCASLTSLNVWCCSNLTDESI
jgi:hypothetical protein